MADLRNVIVIGGAPAGYTAALYLARAKLAPLLVAGTNPGGQLMYTDLVENYPGFPQGIKGPDLMEAMRKQAEKFGTQVVAENVTKVDFRGEAKKIWVGDPSTSSGRVPSTGSGREYQARAVILALGASARMLAVGEEKLLGKGVSTCAVCDAAFYKDKTVFVVGGGDAAMEDALALAKFTNKVTIIHRRGELRASKIMQQRVVEEKRIPIIWEAAVVGVTEKEGKLAAIKVKNINTGEEKEMAAEGLFLAIGHIPATSIIVGQVELDSHGYLLTNLTMNKPVNNQEIWLSGYPTQTSVVGVFGAGDMVDIRYRQAVTAAGMGCMAALDVEKFLTGSISGW